MCWQYVHERGLQLPDAGGAPPASNKHIAALLEITTLALIEARDVNIMDVALGPSSSPLAKSSLDARSRAEAFGYDVPAGNVNHSRIRQASSPSLCSLKRNHG